MLFNTNRKILSNIRKLKGKNFSSYAKAVADDAAELAAKGPKKYRVSVIIIV